MGDGTSAACESPCAVCRMSWQKYILHNDDLFGHRNHRHLLLACLQAILISNELGRLWLCGA